MKKRTFFAALLIAILCVMPFTGAQASEDKLYFYDVDYILDSATEDAIDAKLASVSASTGYDVAVCLVRNMIADGYDDATAYADDFYDYVGFNYNGLCLFISTDTSDWAISTKGEATKAFTDNGQSKIVEEFKPYLQSGDWASAIMTFADMSEEYINYYHETGKAMNAKNAPSFVTILVCIGIGLVAGLIYRGVLKGELKSVAIKNEASDYIKPGTFRVTTSKDFYLYRTVTRVKKQESSGGSSTHTSSSGATHGGSSGKF